MIMRHLPSGSKVEGLVATEVAMVSKILYLF